MADIDDRGQLLLVTGFAIAVAIVALVLLLNTSIYMENRATRSVDTGADDALAYRNTVADNLWPVVQAENERENANRGAHRANVSARIDRFTGLAAYWHIEDGTSANVTNVTLHDGTWLRQTDPGRNMTSSTSTANWTLANDTGDVRAFDLNATGGLESTSNPGSEAFRVNVVGNDGSGDRWSLYVYENGGPTLAVKNGSGPVEQDVCGGPFAAPPEVNLTAGTVNGTDCAELAFAEGTNPPYAISVTLGNRSTGTYGATVNTTTVGSFNGPGPASSPYEVPVVYAVEADVVYRSADLEYRVRIRLPGGDG